MYTINYKKLYLPTLPRDILQDIQNSIQTNHSMVVDENALGEAIKFRDKDPKIVDGQLQKSTDIYVWVMASDTVQQWCNQNISPDMYWYIQVMRTNLPIHKDLVTTCKLNYIIKTGGDEAVTNFYDENKQLIETVRCDQYCWYTLNAQVYHSVDNISQPPRISLSGSIIS
jgi:hypothetical protein